MIHAIDKICFTLLLAVSQRHVQWEVSRAAYEIVFPRGLTVLIVADCPFFCFP